MRVRTRRLEVLLTASFVSCLEKWNRFRALGNLTKFTLKYTLEPFHEDHTGTNWRVRVANSSILTPRIRDFILSSSVVSDIKTMSSLMPINVGMNWEIELSMTGVSMGKKVAQLFFSPLSLAIYCGAWNQTICVSTLSYIVENGADFNAPVKFLSCDKPVPLMTLIVHRALYSTTGERNYAAGPHRLAQLPAGVPVALDKLCDFLSATCKYDFTKSLSLASYLSTWQMFESNFFPTLRICDGFIADVDDSANLFYIAAQYNSFADLLQHLMTSSYLQQLKSDGQFRRAVIGPNKRTLLMAASQSSPRALEFLTNNLDLLIEEPDYDKRKIATRYLPVSLLCLKRSDCVYFNVSQEFTERERYTGKDRASLYPAKCEPGRRCYHPFADPSLPNSWSSN